ncbi:MAG: hypothetical protein ACTHKB_02245 [Burkholderiaceae bacterium]
MKHNNQSVLKRMWRRMVPWLLVWTAGCASTASDPVASVYDPARQARIRIFHGTSAYLYLGNICSGPVEGVIHAANGGFSYLVPNRTIGMPKADIMPSFSYNEYAIPAEKQTTVRMYWSAQNASGVRESCGPVNIVFTPEAGRDYQAWMRFKRGVCQGMELRQLVPQPDGVATTKPAIINTLPFRTCKP